MLRKRFLLGGLLASVVGLFLAASVTGAAPLPWRSDSPAAEARTAVLSGAFFNPQPEPPGSHALAALPDLVNFQGLLTDPGTGNPVPDATYSIRFSIWDLASAGTEEWAETQNVTTVGGLFSVALGDGACVTGCPLSDVTFDGSERWLEVKVEADPAMTPRLPFLSVPYAFHAETADSANSADFATDADTVDGAHASALEESAEIDSDITAHSALASAHHTKTTSASEITSGTMSPLRIAGIAWTSLNDGSGSGLDADTVDGAHASALEESAEIDSDITAHSALSTAHHTPPTSLPPSGAAGGDLFGTYPNPSVANDSHIHTNSTVSDNISINNSRLYAPAGAGNVGIGTTTPGTNLEVFANQNFGTSINIVNPNTGSGASRGIVFEFTGGEFAAIHARSATHPTAPDTLQIIMNQGVGSEIEFVTNGGARMNILDNGDIGIGTSIPSAKLDVVGNLELNGALLCSNCVSASAVQFNYAGSTSEGGSANNALNLTCSNCVSSAEVQFNYAGSTSEGGTANNANLLDNINSPSFLRSDLTDFYTGAVLTIGSASGFDYDNADRGLRLSSNGGEGNQFLIFFDGGSVNGEWLSWIDPADQFQLTNDLALFGNLTVTGVKNAVVETSEGSRLTYAVESPEVWFEDFGSARLQDGAAVVSLDPLFAETVNTEVDYHVFLTPLGKSDGLYVADKSATSFEVRDNSGNGEIDFDYRIVAKRLGYEDQRLAETDVPAVGTAGEATAPAPEGDAADTGAGPAGGTAIEAAAAETGGGLPLLLIVLLLAGLAFALPAVAVTRRVIRGTWL